jgi:hypothetical protein
MFGDAAREILKQFHSVISKWHQGAYYVKYDRGRFTLHPFGSGAKNHFSYFVDKLPYDTFWSFTTRHPSVRVHDDPSPLKTALT